MQEKATWISDISHCMDNVHFDDLVHGTMSDTSSVTMPQSIRDDPRLFKDDVDIRFTRTMNSCKVPQIRYATPERLLERLTDLRFLSIDFLNTFLLTYRVFTDGPTVLEAVKSVYYNPEASDTAYSSTCCLDSGNEGGSGEPNISPPDYETVSPLRVRASSTASSESGDWEGERETTDDGQTGLSSQQWHWHHHKFQEQQQREVVKHSANVFDTSQLVSQVTTVQMPSSPKNSNTPLNVLSTIVLSTTSETLSNITVSNLLAPTPLTTSTHSPTGGESGDIKNVETEKKSTGVREKAGEGSKSKEKMNEKSTQKVGRKNRNKVSEKSTEKDKKKQSETQSSRKDRKEVVESGKHKPANKQESVKGVSVDARDDNEKVLGKQIDTEKSKISVNGQVVRVGMKVETKKIPEKKNVKAQAKTGKMEKTKNLESVRDGSIEKDREDRKTTLAMGSKKDLSLTDPASSASKREDEISTEVVAKSPSPIPIGQCMGLPATKLGNADTTTESSVTSTRSSFQHTESPQHFSKAITSHRTSELGSGTSSAAAVMASASASNYGHLQPQSPRVSTDSKRFFKDGPSICKGKSIVSTAATMRVLNVLRHWISKHSQDFESDRQLKELTVEFLEELVCNSNSLPVEHKAASQLLHMMTRDEFQISPLVDLDLLLAPPGIPSKENTDTLSALDIAEQMTYLDHKIFVSIKSEQFLSQAWMKVDKATKSPNILLIIQRFNDMSRLVVSEIIRQSNIVNRISVIEKWAAIGDICRSMSNFNGVLQICAAFTNSAVFRLKKTWEKVPKTTQQIVDKLQTLVSSDGRFRNLREELHRCDPPCIPYLGMYLTDLSFIEEGTPNFTEDGLLNFSKMRMVAHVIREIRRFQQIPYNIDMMEKVTNYLLDPSLLLPDEELYSTSLALEPRQPRLGSISHP